VCHSDLHAMDGSLPQGAPFVPGHEGAGVITAVGDGVDTLAVGDHVVVAWSPPCGKCNNCVDRKQPHLCVMIQFAIAGLPRFTRGDDQVFGMAGTGTFAEQLNLPQEAAIKIDDDVPFEIASLIGCGVTTGLGAVLNTVRVPPGASVAIIGCGGVGISAIQGARIVGAGKIIAVDAQPWKFDLARDLGATDCVDAKAGDPVAAVQALTGGGADFVFECIGLVPTVEQAVRMTGRGGTTVLVGVVPVTQTVAISAADLTLQEKKITGSLMGSNAFRFDMPKYVDFYLDGRLRLDEMISSRIPLGDINAAFDHMRKGEVARQVIVFD